MVGFAVGLLWGALVHLLRVATVAEGVREAADLLDDQVNGFGADLGDALSVEAKSPPSFPAATAPAPQPAPVSTLLWVGSVCVENRGDKVILRQSGIPYVSDEAERPCPEADPLAGVRTLASCQVVSGTLSRTAFQMGAAGSRWE